VRALARSAGSIAIDDTRLTRIAGDALDPLAVNGALAGADAVIETLGVPLGPEALVKGTTLFSRATRILVDGMRSAGVRRLIVVTGLGAGDSRGVGPLLHTHLLFPLILKRVYDDKDVQEQIVRASALDWTIVRPGILTNGPATGRYQVLTDPRIWHGGFISRRDVADFLVRQVADRSAIGKTPVLIG
jgi:putative NADH-flavin reductase